ncbi:DUF1285 domain-containing protein [uncultured Sphingomonas sp.]|uniref:DUF1285 domain-containing protein n=1 Tax=uncultured Sphingomonas sp. TaxID=158754 RepID=UPI0025D4FEAB|nr:DUF1285 domain-containing protein [uncultured Sphingomonas sp.]
MPSSQDPIRIAGHSLAEIARLAAERRLPPVASWNPPHCGHSDMRIARDGSWYHQGEPIQREAMVRLFSTILRRESDGSHVLVTPAEKLTIDVELAPFVATAMTSEGSGHQRRIAFELNNGDPVLLGPGHPLRLEGEIPLLGVRDGLQASLARPVYYELAELALDEGGDPPGVWSDGCFFPLQSA